MTTVPTVREYEPPAGAQEALVGGIMRQALRFGLKPFLGSPWPFAVQRMALAVGSALMPQDLRATVSQEKIAVNGSVGAIRAERIRPKITGRATPFAILYLHGGAFVAGSPRTHRSITRRLCALTGAQVLVPDYRLAPEAKFPTQIDDCLLAYQQLLNEGVPAHRIAIAGDSAGGNLTYMTCLAAIQQGLPAPAAICLISPVLRMDPAPGHAGDSRVDRASRDPLIRLAWGHVAAKALAIPANHRWAQPERQDLAALPPTLIQVGEDEVLFDDSVWLSKAATQAGRVCELEIHLKRWHVFQAHAGLMPSADQALARMAGFMQRHWVS